MTPYKTSDEQMVEVFRIAVEMANSGISKKFIADTVAIAQEYEGVYDLLILWRDDADPSSREEIIADVQEEIDRLEEAREGTFRAPKINFDELDRNIDVVVQWKRELKLLVERCGGISQLARASGIPQPSLSRFFSSASFPRTSTIFKIIDALTQEANSTWKPPYTVAQIQALIPPQYLRRNREDDCA